MDSIRLLVVGSNNKTTGGIPRYIPEQLEHLSETVDAAVYDIGAPTGSGLVWFLYSLLLALWDAIRFPATAQPDIVHVHTSQNFSFYRASFYVLFAAYIWRCPVLLHVHGSTFDEFVDTDSRICQRLQSIVYTAADEVIVLSTYWRDELEQYVPREKITVLPNAVDPDAYSPSFDLTPPHVVFISNLIPRKGVTELAEALDTVLDHSENVKVSIAGKGPLSDQVKQLADRHAEVTYLGYISEAEKYRLLNDGSIFVLPTYAEGLPIAILEAMAGGNAIIATAVGSIPELIDEDNGILIKPGDSDELIGALEELISSPETVASMAQTNRELIEERYSWSIISEQLEERYKQQLAESA